MPAGATLILQFTPHTDGYLHIQQANGPTITDNREVSANQTVDIPLPKFDKRGPVELRATLLAQPFASNLTGGDASLPQTATITLNIQ